MKTLALAGLVASLVCPTMRAQDDITWEHGPTVARVGNQATINLPKGFVFTHETGTKKFLELSQNPPTGRELGILAPEDLSWFAILSFADVGYVRDNEKDSLDADAVLDAIKSGTEEDNKERRRRGWTTISVVGWMEPPRYDSRTHNLEWGLKGHEETGDVVANHFTRLLGRHGVMTVDFITGINDFDSQIAGYRRALNGISFTPGNEYTAYTLGDKVAEYGLTGLIVGGAAVAGTESGRKVIVGAWKLLAAAIAGIGAFLKKLFSTHRRDSIGVSA